ncbi:hypothetical protein GT755_29325 [Herbidospora sp. NEAU-GS84]|uniref:Uncharacterized protein n=1 Tax=Herbidospora solisilvae TaxID=2696284 RepID=A0A7C9N3X2_9ACTN|nr:hypothetical protein [Herbidospora solisilvae]NAS25770.1 hypothetical protein [Herbidospora solisilvae]
MDVMVIRRRPRIGKPQVGLAFGTGALVLTFVTLGLEQSDQLASVIGVFVGLAGVVIAVHGRTRPENPPADSDRVDTPVIAPEDCAPPVPARPEVTPRYGGDHIEFRGNVFQGPVTGKSAATGPPDRHRYDSV